MGEYVSLLRWTELVLHIVAVVKQVVDRIELVTLEVDSIEGAGDSPYPYLHHNKDYPIVDYP
jgi:hypothetical protein